jgi:putative ABC transport system permease protein
MNLLEHFLSAVDSIRQNAWRAFLTTLGVIIGVSSVVILVSLGEGARSYFGDLFAGMGTNLLLVFPGKHDTKGIGRQNVSTVHRLTMDDLSALEHRGTTFSRVDAFVAGSGSLKYLNRSRDTMVLGVTQALPEVHQMKVAVGNFISADDVEARHHVAVIGRTVQGELFGDEAPIGKSMRVADTRFRVVGIMEGKGQSLGIDFDDLVFIPVTVAMDLFNQEGLTRISIKANSKSDIDPAISEAREILMRRHGNNEDFTIVSQADMLITFNKIASTMELVIIGIASISLLVGGIGIMNIMLVSVKERTREIGLRMAVGARRRDILMQFLVESVTISLLGGVVGLALGMFTMFVFNLLVPEMRIHFTPWVLLVSFGFSVAVGVFFGVFPARKASKLDPIESLRYE